MPPPTPITTIVHCRRPPPAMKARNGAVIHHHFPSIIRSYCQLLSSPATAIVHRRWSVASVYIPPIQNCSGQGLRLLRLNNYGGGGSTLLSCKSCPPLKTLEGGHVYLAEEVVKISCFLDTWSAYHRGFRCVPHSNASEGITPWVDTCALATLHCPPGWRRGATTMMSRRVPLESWYSAPSGGRDHWTRSALWWDTMAGLSLGKGDWYAPTAPPRLRHKPNLMKSNLF